MMMKWRETQKTLVSMHERKSCFIERGSFRDVSKIIPKNIDNIAVPLLITYLKGTVLSNANIPTVLQSPTYLLDNAGLDPQPTTGTDGSFRQSKMDTSTWGSFTGSFFEASELGPDKEGSTILSSEGNCVLNH